MERLPASACLIFVALAVGSSAIQGGVFKELTTPLGQQIMRIAKSAEMRSFMDTSVSPCDDFYGYACGNYATINAATSQKDTNIRQLMFANYLRRVRQVLNEPRISTDRPMEVRVKYFYESCLDTAALRTKQRSHLLSVLREFGGMPAVEGKSWDYVGFDAIEMMAQLLRRYGKLTLLGVYVVPDHLNSQIKRLQLGQRLDLAESDEFASLWKKYALKMRLRNLLGLSEELAGKTAEEIIELESELSRSAFDHRMNRDPRLMRHLTMLSNMSDAYGPILNVTRFVTSWLGTEYNLPVFESVPSYLFQVKKILLSTPNHVVANYMLSSLLTDFEITANEDQQKVICHERITELFPDVVDHMVYHSLEQQNPYIANEMRSLWVELKSSFQEMLSSPDIEWLEKQTREELLEKLNGMSFEIAGGQAVNFEEQYGDLVVSSADYYGNIQRLLEVKARILRTDLLRESRSVYYYHGVTDTPIYETETNLVVLPVSYMQHRYLWDEVYPAALKYGTLGFTLAHEMAHGFDDLNRLYDSRGNLNDNWSSQSKLGFELVKNCLADQFSGMRYGNLRLRRLKSQAESIADNVGIRIAQSAYWKWLDHVEMEETESLPHMTQSPDQLFFLSAAQFMCSDIYPERRANFGRNNFHPPYEARVFAMMINSPAFAEAFQCSNSTKMNPPNKCLMY
ncbi:neprilysin-1 [Drosophila mauritiana]|uniref:Neprilysin-1 n=1 Tax=Drosophila mauritiana TaxID=7226 RepID=A0A6P8KQM9_DROMA|nr:neprilysin-1 [Drosophila mauritiana]